MFNILSPEDFANTTHLSVLISSSVLPPPPPPAARRPPPGCPAARLPIFY